MPFQLPDDAIPPRCDCEPCRDLARCLDEDIRARVAVLNAARRVDAVHKLGRKRWETEPLVSANAPTSPLPTQDQGGKNLPPSAAPTQDAKESSHGHE